MLLDDSTRLAKKLKKSGSDVELSIWENMFHVWHYLGGILPEAGNAISDIGIYIRENHHSMKLRSVSMRESTGRIVNIKSA